MRDINLTVDLFDIRMKDRLALSQDFALTEEQKEELLKAGVTTTLTRELTGIPIPLPMTSIQQPKGLISSLTVPVPNGDVTAVYNRTETTVTDFNPVTLDDLRIKELEENLPRQRASLTATQSITSQWSVLGRGSYYGDWYDSEDDETYTGKVLFDAETSYMATSGIIITLGVQNLLNTYPR